MEENAPGNVGTGPLAGVFKESPLTDQPTLNTTSPTPDSTIGARPPGRLATGPRVSQDNSQPGGVNALVVSASISPTAAAAPAPVFREELDRRGPLEVAVPKDMFIEQPSGFSSGMPTIGEPKSAAALRVAVRDEYATGHKAYAASREAYSAGHEELGAGHRDFFDELVDRLEQAAEEMGISLEE